MAESVIHSRIIAGLELVDHNETSWIMSVARK